MTLCLPLGVAVVSHAQKTQGVTLRGQVLSEKGEALVGATAYLLKDSISREVLSHGTTDAQGSFALECKNADSALFGISFLGYAPYEQSVRLAGQSLSLGAIRLAAQTVEVQSVMVQGRFVRVKQQANGFSVDARGLRSKSNSGLDLLRRIPNVMVRNEEVKVLGKEKVLLKLGNVLQRVEADELSTVLKGVDPSMIKRVEVLMQPPLRYDPEGNTAMIILHTTSFFEQYVGGRVGAEIIYGSHQQRYGGYGTVMMNRGSLFLSVTPYGNYNADATEEKCTYTYPDREYRNVSPSEGSWWVYGGRMTAQYSYASASHVGLTASYTGKELHNAFTSREETLRKGTLEQAIDNENDFKNHAPKFLSTLYNQHGFGGNENQLWTELSYYNLLRRSDTDFAGRLQQQANPFFTYADRDRINTHGWSLKHDYSLHLDSAGRYVLDFGVTGHWTTTDNLRKHSQWREAEPAETFGQESEITLRELLLTPYVSATIKPYKSLWLRVGLRTSTTLSRMRGNGAGGDYQTYTELLPKLHATYTPSRRHKIAFTLNSRIQQPSFSDLNPFEWRINEQMIRRGNPSLLPELNYDYRLQYTWNRALSLYAKATQGWRLITPISEAMGSQIITQTENAQERIYWGGGASYYYDRLSWMQVQLGVYAGQSHYKALSAGLPERNTSLRYGSDLYLGFTLNESGTLNGWVSGGYIGATESVVSHLDPQYSLEAGLSYSLFRRRLSIDLMAMKLYNSPHRGTSTRKGYSVAFDNRYDYPAVYVSLSYRFSNIRDLSTRRRMVSGEVESRF